VRAHVDTCAGFSLSRVCVLMLARVQDGYGIYENFEQNAFAGKYEGQFLEVRLLLVPVSRCLSVPCSKHVHKNSCVCMCEHCFPAFCTSVHVSFCVYVHKHMCDIHFVEQGKMDGLGLYYWAEGDIYMGEYAQDKR
jgi:hypothetical protein